MLDTAAISFIVPFDDAVAPRGAAIAYLVLCCFGFVLIVSSCATQLAKPAPYGKFAEGKDAAESTAAANTAETDGYRRSEAAVAAPAGGLPQRVAHIASDFPAGFVLPVVLFSALSSSRRTTPGAVMLALWLVHYLHRGLIHPLTMRYSEATTPVGICVGGMIPNFTFATAMTLHLAYVDYISAAYFYDPRFIIGVILFVTGYIVNRWADWRLRSLRENSGEAESSNGDAGLARRKRYYVPRGGLFELVSNPNYFGEFVEWCGFAIATSSLFGVLWAVFSLSTFVPRARATRAWYSARFAAEELPQGGGAAWKALIPFIF